MNACGIYGKYKAYDYTQRRVWRQRFAHDIHGLLGCMTGKNSSLFVVLTLPFLLLIAVCMMAVGALIWIYEQTAIDRLIVQTTEQSVQRIDNHIDRFLGEARQTNQSAKDLLASGLVRIDDTQRIQQAVNQMVFSRRFIDTLQVGRTDGSYLGAGWGKDGVVVQKTALAATNWAFVTYTLDKNGAKQSVLHSKANYDATKRPWYMAAAQANHAIWSPVYPFFSSGELGITLSEPLYDPTSGNHELLGVVGVDISLKELSDELDKTKFSKRSVLFILDNQNRVIAQSSEAVEAGGQQAVSLLTHEALVHAKDSPNLVIRRIYDALGASGSVPNTMKKIKIDDMGKVSSKAQSYYVYLSPYRVPHEALDWRVLVATPEADYVAVIGDIGRNMLMLALFSMLVAMLVGLYLATRVTRAINQLKQQVSISSEHAPFVAQKSYGVNELDMLANSFEALSTQLYVSKQNLEETNATLEATVASRTRALRISNENLFQLSHKDELTQIANRRKVAQYFNALWFDFKKDERADICLLLCDVDYFKRYNDTLGHQAGDGCLIAIAKAISDVVRDVDLVARYGGEEFIVLILGDLKAGQVVADKIQKSIADAAIDHPDSPIGEHVTLSIGVAALVELHKQPSLSSDSASVFDVLVGAADKALYEAKSQGRNRAVLASQISRL